MEATVSWLQLLTEESVPFPTGKVGFRVDIQPDLEGDTKFFGTPICMTLMSHAGKIAVFLEGTGGPGRFCACV